jgi:CRP/FNR family transcriptional regulator, anaerobic regulatory protein
MFGAIQVKDSSADLLVELPLSRSEIADYLGLTLETVSRQLGRLRDQRIITIGASRTVIIHRSDVLEATITGPMASELPIGIVRFKRYRRT